MVLNLGKVKGWVPSPDHLVVRASFDLTAFTHHSYLKDFADVSIVSGSTLLYLRQVPDDEAPGETGSCRISTEMRSRPPTYVVLHLCYTLKVRRNPSRSNTKHVGCSLRCTLLPLNREPIDPDIYY